jgi:hypothetical protein
MKQAVLAVALALLVPQSARAHAGPQVRSILFDREQSLHAPTLLIANRGLIFGDADTASWELVCNEVLHVTTSDKPDVAALPDGRILVATARGLLETSDRACNWQRQTGFGEMTNTPALAQQPAAPEVLFVSTYAPGKTGLSKSQDGGKTWRELLHVADTDFLRYIRIARSDPQRMYMAKLGFASSRFVYSVLRSADAGESWQEQKLELTDEETDLELLGVSPVDPDLLLAKAHAADQALMTERLFVSHDGGKRFEQPIRLHTLAQVEWSADGQTLWLATDDGLYRSRDAAKSFERVGAADLVSCVQERDGALYACGWYRGIEAGMPGIGVSHDQGASFERYMNLNEVLTPLECDRGSAAATTCEQLWIDWQREILGYVPGVPAAGTAAVLAAGSGGSAAHAAHGSGGCSLAPASSRERAWSTLVALGWLACGLRRPRRAASLRTKSAG